jgi:hypothetical protein
MCDALSAANAIAKANQNKLSSATWNFRRAS